MATLSSHSSDIEAAVRLLLGGNVIGLPTETVYGLAADGTNPAAVLRIFELKGRPKGHPLILHLGDVSWLERFARDVPEQAHELARRFWPGPLSLVLRRTALVPDEVTGGRESVALRMPAHPMALEVLRRLGRPLAAPSANLFGRVSPTTRAHVEEDFGDLVPLVLDGGATSQGVESTIVDFTGETPRILRHGGVTKSEIEAVLRQEIGELTHVRSRDVQAPGMLASHYAPNAAVVVLAPGELLGFLETLDPARFPASESVGLITQGLTRATLEQLGELTHRGQLHGLPEAECFTIAGTRRFEMVVVSGDARAAARCLYAALRHLDSCHVGTIVASLYDEGGIGVAVRDRLSRAAAPRPSLTEE